MTAQLQALIDAAWEDRAKFSPTDAPADVRAAVTSVIEDLNVGKLRVAERQAVGEWTVHQWIKKAVLLSFRLNDNQPMSAGGLQFFDKVQTKFSNLDEAQLRATGEVTYGRVPSGSVVVSGSLPSADGKYSLYCAVIVKRVDAQTRAKTSINELLRA